MKRYTITTERGIKIQVLANGFVHDKGLIIFKKNIDDSKEDIICVTPFTSTVEVNDV